MKQAILITGAMGGLGRALVKAAESLADIHHIVATDLKKDIKTAFTENRQVLRYIMDVSSEESIRKVRDDLVRQNIRIKYLVNNAGIAKFFPVSEASESRLDQILKVNTYGPVLTVSAFLDDLISSKGRVAQMSSDNVRLSGLFQPYASSKIALESLSVAMRQELNLHGVKLILIRPGAIKTNLLNEVRAAEIGDEHSKYRETFSKFTSIGNKEVGKTVEPKAVAELVMKALSARKPRLIYTINKNAKISFLAPFPHRWIDYLVQKALLSN